LGLSARLVGGDAYHPQNLSAKTLIIKPFLAGAFGIAPKMSAGRLHQIMAARLMALVESPFNPFPRQV
jgi:hypothetical protein